MTQERVPVLIVGAGGAGLSLSLLLLQQGIQPLVIERRSAISIYPRARNLNFRTLEVMRGLGLLAKVREVGTRISQVIFKETLASEEEQTLDPSTLMGHSEAVSPDPLGWYCPQSKLEPLLLETIRERGGNVRYSNQLLSFVQDDVGVTAVIEEHGGRGRYTVQADYLVAADGAHSPVRGSLGISTQGVGVLPEHFIFVYFHAPWDELIAGYESDGVVIKNPDVQGIFLVGGENLGMFLITYRPALGETLQDFTAEHCEHLVRSAIGKPDMPIEIVDIAQWQPAENVAEQFQRGRVFLVGDAAHTMPAYKGLGVNTAIQSAQNLGWKLAAVLHRHADTQLLTTYQEERHPVGRFAARQSLTGPGTAWLLQEFRDEYLPEEVDLPYFYPTVGYRYRSQAVVSEGASTSAPGEIELLEREELTGQPGTRVPHLWLEREGQRISTLDLLDGSFVLLAGDVEATWRQAARALKASLGIKLISYRIGGSDADLLDLEHGWTSRMGMSPEGAMLIRPDGFVAWRTQAPAADPEAELEQVLSHILCRAIAPVPLQEQV